MDTNSSIIPYLFLITFLIALVIGVMQFRKARKARDEHHRSASAKEQGEPYASSDTPRDQRASTVKAGPDAGGTASVMRD